MRYGAVVLGVVAIAGVALWYLGGRQSDPEPEPSLAIQTQEAPASVDVRPEPPAVSGSPENTVTFQCAQEKSFVAVFTRDIVGVTLSDGRQFELRQVPASSGARYENAFEKVVLLGSNEGARFEEAGSVTYGECTVEP